MNLRNKTATHNSTYPKGGVSCSKDSFVVNQTLDFHKKTFLLLNKEPISSDDHIRILEEKEKQHNISFPRSVKEYFSLKDSLKLLEEYSNNDEISPLDTFGDIKKNWYTNGNNYNPLSDNLIIFLTENQGVCNWAFKLDSSDDPSVLVEIDTAPNPIWKLCSNSFSSFIYNRIWDHFFWFNNLFLNDSSNPLSKKDLDYLKTTYLQEETSYGWPGDIQYRFFKNDQCILLWDSQEQCDWHISAKSQESLNNLKKSLEKNCNIKFTIIPENA